MTGTTLVDHALVPLGDLDISEYFRADGVLSATLADDNGGLLTSPELSFEGLPCDSPNASPLFSSFAMATSFLTPESVAGLGAQPVGLPNMLIPYPFFPTSGFASNQPFSGSSSSSESFAPSVYDPFPRERPDLRSTPSTPRTAMHAASVSEVSPSVKTSYGSLPTSGSTSVANSSPGSPETSPLTAGDVSMMPKKSLKSQTRKKRRPKPRMCELSASQAKAKRDANRESARKCRERKREKEREVICEKTILRAEVEKLRNALEEERVRSEMLSKLLTERNILFTGAMGVNNLAV